MTHRVGGIPARHPGLDGRRSVVVVLAGSQLEPAHVHVRLVLGERLEGTGGGVPVELLEDVAPAVRRPADQPHRLVGHVGGVLGGLGLTAAAGFDRRALWSAKMLGIGAAIGGVVALEFLFHLHDEGRFVLPFALWQAAMGMGIKEATLQTGEVEAHGDTAFEVGRFTLRGEGGHVLDQGKYIVIWKQEGGQWKFHRDIWNSSQPTAQP